MTSATKGLKPLYFLYYASVGASLTSLNPYLRGLGFDGRTIGLLQAIPPIAAPLVSLAWARLADQRGDPSLALRRATLLAAAAALLLPVAVTPWAIAGVILLQSLGDRAVVPLADAVTIEATHARPGPSYGSIRLFGSLGFIAAALGLGAILALRGGRSADPLVPVAVAAALAATAVAARRVPPPPWSARARPAAATLPWDRRLVTLLGLGAVHWAATAPFHQFFGVHVQDLGLPAGVTGMAMALGVAAEVAVLLWFERLERLAPLPTLLAVAFAGSAARWLLVAVVHSAPALVLLQLLHGLTFGLFWASAVRAMSLLVPARRRATGQALFGAVVFGLGNGLGAPLAGLGYDLLGGAGPVFALAGALEAALALVTLWLARGRGWPARGPADPGG